MSIKSKHPNANFSGPNPATGRSWTVQEIVDYLGLRAYNDPDELRPICQQVLDSCPKEVESYRKGKTKVFGRFIKLVMEETQSGADPKVTQEVLKNLLSGPTA